MFLSDIDIKKALKEGKIVIKPFNEKNLQPASYDVSLGNDFEIFIRHKTRAIDLQSGEIPNTHKIKVRNNEEFILHPGESILAKQREFIGVGNEYVILLSGKSSLARIGLVVHNTAMLFNPGHYFYPTFELFNTNTIPIVLHPGMLIAQLLFAQLSSKTSKIYKRIGRYDSRNSKHFVLKK